MGDRLLRQLLGGGSLQIDLGGGHRGARNQRQVHQNSADTMRERADRYYAQGNYEQGRLWDRQARAQEEYARGNTGYRPDGYRGGGVLHNGGRHHHGSGIDIDIDAGRVIGGVIGGIIDNTMRGGHRQPQQVYRQPQPIYREPPRHYQGHTASPPSYAAPVRVAPPTYPSPGGDFGTMTVESYLTMAGAYIARVDGIQDASYGTALQQYAARQGMAATDPRLMETLRNDPVVKANMDMVAAQGRGADPNRAVAFQTVLASEGHSPGAIDGILGRNSLAAYQNYNAAYYATHTMRQNFAQAAPPAAAPAPAPEPPAARLPDFFGQQAAPQTPPARLPDFFPEGAPELETRAAPAVPAAPPDLDINLLRAEALLALAGEDPGEIDGIGDQKTVSAIAHYAHTRNFDLSQGAAALLDHMKKDPSIKREAAQTATLGDDADPVKQKALETLDATGDLDFDVSQGPSHYVPVRTDATLSQSPRHIEIGVSALSDHANDRADRIGGDGFDYAEGTGPVMRGMGAPLGTQQVGGGLVPAALTSRPGTPSQDMTFQNV